MALEADTALVVRAFQTGDEATFDKAALTVGLTHIAKSMRGPTTADVLAAIETRKALTTASTELVELLQSQLQEAEMAKTEGRISPADQRHATVIKTATAYAERGEAVREGVFKQSDIMAAQRFHAGQIRKDGETPAQVNARAWTTPDGQALRKALRTATPDAPIEVMKSTVGEATAEVHRRALALQAASGHSIQKARTIVRGLDADLARRESAEGRAA